MDAKPTHPLTIQQENYERLGIVNGEQFVVMSMMVEKM